MFLGYSAAADIIMATLPWKFLLTLKISKTEKFGVMVAMSMGIL
jgi:hypothetical protein